MRAAWMVGVAFVAAGCPENGGSDPSGIDDLAFNAYCNDKIACTGETLADCIDMYESVRSDAKVKGCATQYVLYFTCSRDNGTCEDGVWGSAECDAAYDALFVDCLSL